MGARRNNNPRATGPLDRKIGLRIRDRRLEMGISQVMLAEELGISFQQVQKYEKGLNRVAAATLINISQVLGVPVADLFPHAKPSSAARTSDELGVAEFLPLLRELSHEDRRVLANMARGLIKKAKLVGAKRRPD